jgi:hypothetical protein
MAKLLNEFPSGGQGPNGRVLKEEWFDGQVWQLDSKIVGSYKSTTSCRSAIYQYARRRGWESVKTRIHYNDDQDIPDLIIQCIGVSAKYWLRESSKRKQLNQSLWEDCSEQVHKFNPMKNINDVTVVRDICELFDEMTVSIYDPPVNESNV